MTDRTTPAASIAFAELLEYERETLARWSEYLAAHPEALDLPFAPSGDARLATVRGVVHHLVAVERRYADRLAGEPPTPYESIPSDSAGSLMAAARDANARLARWLEGADGAALARVLEFQTISAGTQRASARKIVAHALLHGVRTWAQLATVVRLHGLPTAGGHDLLMSRALD
jgi:uncharacterized damage-inducible protein DinB